MLRPPSMIARRPRGRPAAMTLLTLLIGFAAAGRVSAGEAGAWASLADGTVAGWGDDSRGALGNGTRVSSPTPVAVPGLNDITSVSVRDQHACALHANGTVSCWGWSGRLG